MTEAKTSAGPTLALPVVNVVAANLAEGWERAVVRCWEDGVCVPTEYDKAGDPPSRDVALFLAVADAFAEPRLHRAFPAGIEELESYRQEVVDGIHDHWVDPAAGKWEYTYHERMTAFTAPGLEAPVNQLDQVLDALARAPHTRRAQAITWKPWQDAGITDPPCLQRMWFRVFGDQLVLSVHLRSNDAFKAAFMNMYAFTELQKVIAERLSERIGRPIRPGQYNHICDSFHIYGSYFTEFDGFLQSLRRRSFEERTWRTADVAEMIEEARAHIAAAKDEEQRTGRKGL
jgi:thymidylate synthase